MLQFQQYFVLIMYEYLLSIAEKIIDSSAPATVSQKYYQLKKSILARTMTRSRRVQNSAVAATINKQNSLNLQHQKFQSMQSKLKELQQKFEIKHQPSLTRLSSKSISISQKQNYKENLRRKQQLMKIQQSNIEIKKDNEWLLIQIDKLIKQNKLLRKIGERKD